MSTVEEFRAFAAGLGYELPPSIEPGRRFRFSVNGKRSDDAGWGTLFADGEGGVIGDWRTGAKHVWQAKRDRKLTPDENRELQAKIERERREAQAEREREEAQAAAKADAIWKSAKQAPSDHPYLKAKRVPPRGLGIYAGPPLVISGMDCSGALIVPLRNAAGAIRSLEFIGSDGEKRFLPGGVYRGCYFGIGGAPTADRPLCIAEGFSTAASIHAATGYGVAAAAAAGNLEVVARTLRERYPQARIILCADDDYRTEGNPGRTKAAKAAKAIGAMLAVPDFGPNRPEGATDFNDLAIAKGLEAVRAALEGARLPDAGTPTADATARAIEASNATEAPVAAVAQARAPDSGRTAEKGAVIHCRMLEIEAKPIRWLWPGRIARGKVSMIAGHPGLGKSQITTGFAAVVTQGGRWPVDRTPCEPGSVLLLSAEDDAADTIRPRLEAAGADLARVHIVQAIRDGFNAAGDEIQRPFNLKEDIRRLELVLTEIGDVALIVIDPVSAYLGGTDSHNNADVRTLLAPLGEMAARTGAAVIAVSHLNKGGASGGGDALLRVTGSLAFVAAARAAYIVAKDPTDDRRRLFLPAKNNVAADIGGLAFGIEPCSIGRGIETSRIVWEAEVVTGVSADELLRPQADPEERSAVEDAAEFLRALLADGPMPAKKIYAEARGAGHSEASIRRAQKPAGIEVRKVGGHFGKGVQQWVWALKVLKKPEDDQDSQAANLEHLEYLQPGSAEEDGSSGDEGERY